MDEPVAPTSEEPEAPEAAPEAEAPQRTPPALTITIQSWATPIIGLVMLIIGAAAGFFLRPVILSGEVQPTSGAQVESSSAPSATAAANPNAGEIMKLVAEQTRHFAGAEDAPVTIIEFSDYQ